MLHRQQESVRRQRQQVFRVGVRNEMTRHASERDGNSVVHDVHGLSVTLLQCSVNDHAVRVYPTIVYRPAG
jgi:hypothetical protein